MEKKKIMISFIILGVFLWQICYADVIGPQIPFYSTPMTMEISNLLITLAVEMFFAWIMFFKKDHKSLRTVFFVNIISQPIAQVSLFYLSKNSDVLFFLAPIELIIIFLETIAYKLLLDGISFWRALKISLILNILSIVIGFIIFAIVLLIGMFLPNFAYRSYNQL